MDAGGGDVGQGGQVLSRRQTELELGRGQPQPDQRKMIDQHEAILIRYRPEVIRISRATWLGASAGRSGSRPYKGKDLVHQYRRRLDRVDGEAGLGPRLVLAGLHLGPGGDVPLLGAGDAGLDPPAVLVRVGADHLDHPQRHALRGGEVPPAGRAASTGLTASATTVVPRWRLAAATASTTP